MKNIARKLSALLLVFVVSAAALCPAFAAKADLPELPKDQYVVDEANVLSSSTEQTIIQLNNQLQANCKGATIGVLTVDYTGSCTTEEYALQAANAWGIGSSTGNNGVLILLVMETQQYADGDYYIATGDGFRNTTLESQASALAQTMEDDFVRQDYDDAVTTCARNVAQTIADIYGVSLSGGNTGNNNPYNEPSYEDNSSGGGFGDIVLGFITILFTVVLLLIIVSVVVYTFSGPLSGLFWCFGGPWHRGPRPPRGRRNPPPPPPGGPYGGFGGPGPGGSGGRGPRNSPPPRRTPPRSTPPRSGGFGGGSFGGGSFGGGSFGGMGGGSFHGGGGGRGR